MKQTKQRNKKIVLPIYLRGFILPFTMFISVLVLFISTGALALLSKQQYFSKIYKQTQAAYYAADDAIACTIMIDDSYVSSDGLGIFPSNFATRATYIQSVLDYMSSKDGAPTITQANITCGQSPIFVSGGTPTYNPLFTISDTQYQYNFTNPVTLLPDFEIGVTSSYTMKMDLGLDPTDLAGIRRLYRCAKITVNKTTSFRQILSQGYSTCDGTGNGVERAVVNTTVIQ